MLFNPISTAVVLLFIGGVVSKKATSRGTISDDDPDTDPVKYARVAGDPIQGDSACASSKLARCVR